MDGTPLDHARAARLATLERFLAHHIRLAALYRAECGPESGLVQVNTTALVATMRKLKTLRAGLEEDQWYRTRLTEAESAQATVSWV